MKILNKVLFTIMMLVVVNTGVSQSIETQDKPNNKLDRQIEVEVLPAYVPLYVISDKELPSFFTSGEIPESFPKYDPSLKKGANKKIAIEWCIVPSNRALLTEDAKARVDAKLDDWKAKSNK
jgi:hypothetical protein